MFYKKGFFVIALSTSSRSLMITNLQLRKITKCWSNVLPEFWITPVIFCDAVSKRFGGGMREANERPIEAAIFKSDQFYGILCIYDDL